MTELETRIVELYKSGVSFADISKQLHIHTNRIKPILEAQHILIYRSRRKYYVNEHAFDVIDNELAAYWLGFLYADGTVAKNYVSLNLGRMDEMMVYKFAEFMESDARILQTTYATPQTRTTINSVHLATRLRELGIQPRRPAPQAIVDNVPQPMFHHWLRGFFDGDGSATVRKSLWFCGDEELLKIIRAVLAREAGRNPQHTIWRHKTAKLFYLRYRGYASSRAIADYMYQDATFWLPRKRDRIDSWTPVDYSERSRLGWIKRHAHSTPA